MKFPVFVHDEIDSSYDGKKGHVGQRSLILADASEGSRLLQFLEYPLKGPEKEQLEGKCKHKTLDLEVLEIPQVFGGRPRIGKGSLRLQAK